MDKIREEKELTFSEVVLSFLIASYTRNEKIKICFW